MKSRTRFTVINSSVSTVIYIIRTLLGFVARSIFIYQLGVSFLGLNGLFTNVLSFLSLAELGIGTSIVYELYKPIAMNDREKIKSLMKLYKGAYDFIGIVVFCIGMLVIPVLPFIIKNGIHISNVYSYYVLFLMNSVVSYFFTYKRSLLNADQKNYVTVINDFVFYCATIGLQMYFLVAFHSYMLYLLVQIVATITSNLCISHIVNKRYPFINEKKVYPVSKKVTAELKKNIVGNISSQVGSIIVLGSDNILISAFVGLTVVGIYSNYTLITNAIRSTMQQATSAVVSSFGNLVAQSSADKTYSVFKSYWFVNTCVSFISGISIFSFINNFIAIWIGEKYLLPMHTVFLMSIYLVILMYQGTARTFISAYGLFWQQRWKPIFEATINLVFSLLFMGIFHLGVDGVLMGTLCSSIFVIIWFEPYIVFKYGLQRSVKNYAYNTVEFYCKFLLAVFVISKIQPFLIVTNIVDFIKALIVQGIVIAILFFILFGRNPALKEVLHRFKRS